MQIQSVPAAHPAAELFPAMDADEYAALRQSIREHGQQEPIVMHEDMILDGRHRYRACLDEGRDPETTYWLGECGSPTAFVIAKNLHRRHLSAGQRAAIAVESLPMFEAEASERRRELGRVAAEKQHHPERVPQIVAEPKRAEAREDAARATSVNRQYVSDAKRIREEAPEVFEQVRNGEITIPEAKREIQKRDVEEAVATVERAIEATDIDGRVAGARLAAAFARTLAHITGTWLPLKPEAVASVLDDHDWEDVAAIESQIRDWFDALQSARSRVFQVIGGNQ